MTEICLLDAKGKLINQYGYNKKDRLLITSDLCSEGDNSNDYYDINYYIDLSELSDKQYKLLALYINVDVFLKFCNSSIWPSKENRKMTNEIATSIKEGTLTYATFTKLLDDYSYQVLLMPLYK